jgi:ubiquinone/menaquinone biosynthesis C-methylase UbiE
MMDAKSHWSNIYQTKAPNQVSWYQDYPQLSMEFIQSTGVDKTGQIIDVGGGASTLADHLIDAGYQNLTVLDISGEALETTRRRLGEDAHQVIWLEADITQVELPHQFYDVWHDRAVFHFLTRAEDRQRYINTVRHSVKVGGHVIVATFALDGPEKCSGLDVVRYSPQNLKGEFGDAFKLVESANETHHTPFGTDQKFVYCYCGVCE